jgi:hypothetical protein
METYKLTHVTYPSKSWKREDDMHLFIRLFIMQQYEGTDLCTIYTKQLGKSASTF